MDRDSEVERLAWRVFVFFHEAAQRRGQIDLDETGLYRTFAKEGEERVRKALAWLEDWNLVARNGAYHLTQKGKGSHWVQRD